MSHTDVGGNTKYLEKNGVHFEPSSEINIFIFFVILQHNAIFNFLCVDYAPFDYYSTREILYMSLRFFQRLPVVKVTSHFLPNGAIQVRGSGFLTILTSGSVIQASPELMYF